MENIVVCALDCQLLAPARRATRSTLSCARWQSIDGVSRFERLVQHPIPRPRRADRKLRAPEGSDDLLHEDHALGKEVFPSRLHPRQALSRSATVMAKRRSSTREASAREMTMPWIRFLSNASRPRTIAASVVTVPAMPTMLRLPDPIRSRPAAGPGPPAPGQNRTVAPALPPAAGRGG